MASGRRVGQRECDWLIELSDNRLSNNNLASELKENRSFLNQSQSRKLMYGICLTENFLASLNFELIAKSSTVLFYQRNICQKGKIFSCAINLEKQLDFFWT